MIQVPRVIVGGWKEDVMSTAGDFIFNLVPSAQPAMPMDTAIALALSMLGLPELGGPSGRGASYYRTYEKCPHLFSSAPPDGGIGAAPDYLEIGALYHVLMALSDAERMQHTAAISRGIREYPFVLDATPKSMTFDRAAERLARILIQQVQTAVKVDKPELACNPTVLTKAIQAWRAHEEFYDAESYTPLAVEWYAEHPERAADGATLYSCRYDRIARIEAGHPFVDTGRLQPGAIVAYEHKTAGWLYDSAKDGWSLDPEVLGQLWLWEPSGMAKTFGPLAGVVIDVVTKQKTPVFHRMLIPHGCPPVSRYEHWIRYTAAQIHMAKVTGVFKQNYSSCYDKFGRCPQFENCEQLAWGG